MLGEIERLQQVLREQREKMPEDLAVRLHRALSWLRCAEGQAENPDMQFISLWIAFNACYAIDVDDALTLGERERFQSFLTRLVVLDKDSRIYNCLWQTFSGPVRALLGNQFLFRPFWDAQRGQDANWAERFEKSQAAAKVFLAKGMVAELLSVVLDRLYVLRNQLMHGGATWQSRVNRGQVRDGCNMLRVLLPIVIEEMLRAREADWGRIHYPVVKG